MDTTATSTAITNTMPTQVIALDERQRWTPRPAQPHLIPRWRPVSPEHFTKELPTEWTEEEGIASPVCSIASGVFVI